MPGGKAMILAFDQGFEHGPRDFLGHPESRDFEYILNIAEKGGFTAIVAHAGLAEKYRFQIRKSGVPLILKLNGKSELYAGDDPYSPRLYSVEDAITLGATAVGYTVYSGSKYEDQMNIEFAGIIREAHKNGLPAIGWMYPRGKSLSDEKTSVKTIKMGREEKAKSNLEIDETPSIVAYGARIGMELGADIVKVKYTGSVESFKWVVQSAFPTNVVMSGGPMTKTDEDFLSMVKNVIAAGATGIAVGRNVWQRKDPLSISAKLRKVILG
ncbi:MAG: aldolase [Chloroflexi bacterium]|nr:aldolase [Chloroflexota bacterium]